MWVCVYVGGCVWVCVGVGVFVCVFGHKKESSDFSFSLNKSTGSGFGLTLRDVTSYETMGTDG